jgi:hypothetical protein
VDFSFSTGGGAGTSIFNGVITEARRLKASFFAETGGNFFNSSASSNAEGGTTAGGVYFAGAFGDTGDTGGNLNSLFIDPFLLFLFSTFTFCTLCDVGTGAIALVGLVDARSRRMVSVVGSSSASASSGVGSNWRSLNTLAEKGWLTKLGACEVPSADVREGHGIEEQGWCGFRRWEVGWWMSVARKLGTWFGGLNSDVAGGARDRTKVE